MFKKISCILICIVFLLSVSCVVASDSFETDNATDLNDNTVIEEDNNLDDEFNSEEYSEDVINQNDYNQLELNTTGIVMSNDEYSCGAASFATVLNNLGVNITLDEAKTAVNTTVNGTTMEGIINGANKYNLTACAINVNTADLKENFIVHMNILGINHWSVVKEIGNETIILADPNLGNFEYDLTEFNQYYTNQTIFIGISEKNNFINNIISKNINFISKTVLKTVSGNGYAYYVSEYKDKIPVKPKGFAIRFTIIVPKWGGKTIKLKTTKVTTHRISTKVVYTIKLYSKSNFKGKVETIYQPAFFNFASKKGASYSVTRKSSFGIQSIKWSVKTSPFPYS